MSSQKKIHTVTVKLHELPLNTIKPHDFIREFLDRQVSGLSGNVKEQKYPFNTCCWEGVIQAEFRELDYRGQPCPVPGPNRWWPYEQTGYMLDGLLRLGLLTGNEEMTGFFKRNLDYLLAHHIGGRLGGECYKYSSEWPMGVFYKAVRAYLDVTGDENVLDAFHEHYRQVSAAEIGDGSRNITNIEGLLDIAARTGDDSLIAKAFQAYDMFNTHQDKNYASEALTMNVLENYHNIIFHGVTLSEEIKLPVMLYMAGGDKRYFDAACRAWQLVMDMHGQISGVPCSVEHAFGRDPETGYETCVISDALYSLGFFLMAGGGGKYADQAEKIAYNALPGAVTKDFSALQYLSAPNQVLATPFSNSSSFLFGQAPLRQYRPDHFAACCPGNVHRAMPNFVSRMWMADENGAPAAVCFGPCDVSGIYQGKSYQIIQHTEYPFKGEISFECRFAGDGELPFSWRIPQWCSGVKIKLNGEALELPDNIKGEFLQTKLRNNDKLVLDFALDVRQCSDRQWSWFERGALVYSLPVGNVCRKEEPEKRFTPLIMEPVSAWNYAVAPQTAARVIANVNAEKYGFDAPPELLQISARRVPGAFAELDQQRYTPQVPLFCTPEKEETLLHLVPFGATETRLTAFPDGLKRTQLPILSAYTVSDTETEHPETLEPMAFRDIAREIRIDRDGYYDLARFYCKTRYCGAYLQIRFFAEKSGKAMCCAMLSDGGYGFINGKKVLEIPPLMEAEFMHPLWFPIEVDAGYNYLLLHVVDGLPTYDHREAWGAKVKFFC